MVTYDTPAIVDKILNVTNRSSINYVGHSQGTMVMFAKLSLDLEFSKKVSTHSHVIVCYLTKMNI